MIKFMKKCSLALLVSPIVFSSLAIADAPEGPSYIGATKSLVNETSSVRLSFLDNANNEDHYEVIIQDYNSGAVHATKSLNAVLGSGSYIYETVNGLECNNLYKAVVKTFGSNGEYSETERVFNIHTTFGVSCDDFIVDIGDDITASLSDTENGTVMINLNPTVVQNNTGEDYIKGYWSVVSAPENYNGTFIPPYEFQTTFVTETPGVYVLKLQAYPLNAAEAISVDTVTLTVIE